MCQNAGNELCLNDIMDGYYMVICLTFLNIYETKITEWFIPTLTHAGNIDYILRALPKHDKRHSTKIGLQNKSYVHRLGFGK